MRKKIEGLRAIDSAITQIGKVAQNLNDRVQDVLVAIVEHAAGAGNGDVSRALTLVKTIKRYPTLNSAFVVGWLRYFGNCNVNLSANDGAGKVSLLSKDSKAYRGGFDVDGARANNWADAIDKDGNRAAWYSGPEPAEFQPYGIGDIADRMQQFAERTAKLLDATKEVKGKEVPQVRLSADDRQQVNNALAFLSRIAATLARHDDVETLKQELAKAEAEAGADDEFIQIVSPKEKMVA